MALFGTVSPDKPLTNRNLIINGAMQVAQRSGSVSSITTSDYRTVDRWLVVIGTAGTWTIEQSSVAPTGFSKSLKMDCTSADSSLGSSDEIIIAQRIEGQNLQHLKYGTSEAESLTLSFWVRSNKTGTYTVEFDQYGDRQISRTYTINSANTWEYKTMTVPGDTVGTISDVNTAEYQLLFWLGAGSNLKSGTLNTSGWASVTNANRVSSSQVNLADSTDNEWYVTGIQLEVGSVATPFERRSYAEELRLCQRYYEKGGVSRRSGNRSSGSQETTCVFYKVTKRANPTFSVSGGYTFDGWSTYQVGGHDNPSGSNDPTAWGNLECVTASGATSGAVMACTWTSSAEL